MTSTSDAALHEFRNAYSRIMEVPYYSGIIPLDEKTSTLFYRREGKAGVVDFAKISEFELKALVEACQPATFGLENKDVLDESYRKAGKLDASDFSLQFSPASTGIIDKIRDFLLQGLESDRSIQVELYKLNVYGPGAFFKSHVDTPRSDNIFGSLVIVLPTIHEGGSLIFRHAGEEQTFDSAKEVSSQASPHAAFIAFYSDVDHEVSPVKSGYRVTITYNLYFAEHQESQARDMFNDIFSAADEIAQLKSVLETLKEDPHFLPEGGLLGFSLFHKYPFSPDTSSLGLISNSLKGSDSVVKHICEALGLQVSLKAIYNNNEKAYDGIDYFLSDKFIDLEYTDYDASLASSITEYGSMCVSSSTGNSPVRESDYGDVTPIVWMKALKNLNRFPTPYIYGSDLCFAYGEICLIAEIEEVGVRNAK